MPNISKLMLFVTIAVLAPELGRSQAHIRGSSRVQELFARCETVQPVVNSVYIRRLSPDLVSILLVGTGFRPSASRWDWTVSLSDLGGRMQLEVAASHASAGTGTAITVEAPSTEIVMGQPLVLGLSASDCEGKWSPATVVFSRSASNDFVAKLAPRPKKVARDDSNLARGQKQD